MISAEARPYIDASVPVLREHGLAITSLFYRNLFEEYPELSNIFNMGNQANGSQQQSLASAVFAYAANIDNAAALAPVISRIVHKHVSLGIKPSHYPIVGQHLLQAIQHTLGDAATPALLSAWAEAYGLLAQALIDEEDRLYRQSGTEPGALFDMRVTAVQKQSTLVTSFTLERADGSAVPDFVPGQYVSVAITLPGGLRQLRQYSLSDAPGKSHLRISVKREPADAETPAGMVSNWLHDHLALGSILPVSTPCGDFAPGAAGDGPVVLLSAGVGITPMIAALNHIAATAPQRQVIFAHAARDVLHHAHRADLARARELMPNLLSVVFYEDAGKEPDADSAAADGAPAANVMAGLMDVDKLVAWPLADTRVYLCGPIKFMQAQWLSLIKRGVPPTRLHREVFGPDMLDHLL
ncbi:NO-inducible flavohemoprotein [Undibacterium sp.]|jgi:nitric oxide dioxygenase|uniref:NO-inducible flavohemoprotein n=1 Tax=Undibacterium sp. TaxID=1914977 RepID=UPI002C049CE3|nr:NO-inducible flavohemoprotein [Undibacterium sp.]HTD05202.1 NO-inducible flavohemoprotein [Undibacterium sp.]